MNINFEKKSKMSKISKLLKYLLFERKKMLVVYYTGTPNIGDKLNETIAQIFLKREISNPPGAKYFNHYLMIGSLLEYMNERSTVWGSGFMSETAINRCKALGNILAVRGNISKGMIEKKFAVNLKCPVGDPALLAPLALKFQKSSKKKYPVGLILHYVDRGHTLEKKMTKFGGLIIDVGLPPTQFIERLVQCDAIVSSSLHGLILSDAYGVPNIRIKVSDKIVGGDFKFIDYYSTTINQKANNDCIIENESLIKLDQYLEKVSIKKYMYDLNELLNSRPK